MRQLLFLLLILTGSVIKSQILWQIDKDTVITYSYLDGDEFSSNEIRKDKWDSWYGWARSISGNKEQQYYSDFKNHEQKNGCLYLYVRKTPVEARLVDWMSDNDSIKDGTKFLGFNKRSFNYTSGMLSSKTEYKRGYFEIKFKAPSEKGLWPAFWLYGGSPNEEIDFMELKGERQDEIHVDTHCPNRCDYIQRFPGSKKSFGGWVKLDKKLDEGFTHVSGTWDENEIRYYVNGQCVAISKVKFDAPKKLVINIAVPSDDGPFHPGPDPSIENFSPMVVDYVRVWTKENVPGVKKERPVFAGFSNAFSLINSEMKKKNKFLYGKKEEHQNEGIFLSLFRDEAGSALLFCNGLTGNDSYNLKVTDANNKTLLEQAVTDREFKIPVTPSAGTQVEITFLNRQVKYTF